jgi:4-hydroxy-4-methyl-2-oxoglutarate aldolase|tara:strand:+ start:4546 stop:5355 length:810 start_codon:yes stop_codon:yes gene_type:complete
MKLTNSEMISAVTSKWEGDRDSNGRPLVSEGILERMKLVTTEEAWGTCKRNGYHFQFAGNWMNLHTDRVIVGRALTCRWVPRRPDIHDSIDKQGVEDDRVGFQNSWVIDELEQNDLIVVDLFGKVFNGTFAGDNLATAIKSRSGTGMVIDGGIRDAQRIIEMDDFNAFVRGVDPSAILDVSMPEINGITRIGEATCVPGDVVLGTSTGVVFIPPHLALEVVERSEAIRLKDEFGQQRIREGIYTPGEVDRKFSEDMNNNFEEWKANRLK